jgi:hypothetical protein
MSVEHSMLTCLHDWHRTPFDPLHDASLRQARQRHMPCSTNKLVSVKNNISSTGKWPMPHPVRVAGVIDQTPLNIA